MIEGIMLTNDEAYVAAGDLAATLFEKYPRQVLTVYCIGAGGYPALLLVIEKLAKYTHKPHIVFSLVRKKADIYITDIMEDGMVGQYSDKPLYCLFHSRADRQFLMPWRSARAIPTVAEQIATRLRERKVPFFANDNIADHIDSEEVGWLEEDLVRRAQYFLRGLVIDIDNDHNTRETARRLAKMYIRELFAGRYLPSPSITSFPNSKGYDGLYITQATIRSTCSHHFAPIVGKVHIGIVPGDRVIGLSKFNRIVEWLASRPQIQEELVMQIADRVEKECAPRGVAVSLRAQHFCMTMRGVKEHDADMVTNEMRGVFRTDNKAREEFLLCVRG